MARTWVKVYCHKTLEGSLRKDVYNDFPIESLLKFKDDRQNVLRILIRGIWLDILVMAGESKYGYIGEIKLSEKVGYTDDQIADVLSIPLPLWVWAKTELSQGDEARISVNDKNVIKVINWSKYQSEYQRQKPYREKTRPEDPKKGNDDKEAEPANWLDRLEDTFPDFSPDKAWIDMILRAWKDIDLEAMTQEFVSFWRNKLSGDVESSFINSLQYARDNKKFQSKEKDYTNQGKYSGVIQR